MHRASYGGKGVGIYDPKEMAGLPVGIQVGLDSNHCRERELTVVLRCRSSAGSGRKSGCWLSRRSSRSVWVIAASDRDSLRNVACKSLMHRRDATRRSRTQERASVRFVRRTTVKTRCLSGQKRGQCKNALYKEQTRC